MSADAKNIRLDESVLAELQVFAQAQQKSPDQLAAELIQQSLKLTGLESILAKGKQYGTASGFTEHEVVNVIHAERLEPPR